MKKLVGILTITLSLFLLSNNGRGEYVQFCKQGNAGVCVTGAGGWEAFKCDPSSTLTKDCSGTYLKDIGNNPNWVI